MNNFFSNAIPFASESNNADVNYPQAITDMNKIEGAPKLRIIKTRLFPVKWNGLNIFAIVDLTHRRGLKCQETQLIWTKKSNHRQASKGGNLIDWR